jgi:hypothetical protein
MSFHPLASFWRANRSLLTGRLHFPPGRIGQPYRLPDGSAPIIFREARMIPVAGKPDTPGAQFHVRFHLKGMSNRLNRWFSLLPIPFFIGLPGFRHKLWMVDPETGDCHGVYQWDSVAAAEQYAASFAMRFMTGRSVPGSVVYAITPLSTAESEIAQQA